MKIRSYFTVTSLAVFVLSVFVLASCSSKPKFENGMAVCAKWSSSWYEATITGESGGMYDVRYGDGVTGKLSVNDIKVNCKKGDVKVGDKVLAVWTSLKYYEGTVTEVKDEGCIVQWTDGSSPSLAVWGKIAKL